MSAYCCSMPSTNASAMKSTVRTFVKSGIVGRAG